MPATWRITTVWQKVVYIVAGCAVFALLLFALGTWLLDVRSLPCAIVGFALSFTALGYLNSSFRLLRHPELWSQSGSKSVRVASTAD